MIFGRSGMPAPLMWILTVLRWAPYLFMYLIALHLFMITVYLMARPETFIQAAFGLMDLAPWYAQYVVERVGSEIRSQLGARLR